MGFRAFLVMDNKVARQEMAGNGGKWQKMVEKSSPRLFGRKWCFRMFYAFSLLLFIIMVSSCIELVLKALTPMASFFEQKMPVLTLSPFG